MRGTLLGDKAIHDREGGAGFAVQSGHGVIVSISDVLRACQAADFGFRGIAREPARLSPSLPVHPKTLLWKPPNFRRWAWMGQLAQDFKPPGEMARRTMPLLLSDAGMGPLVAFFACRDMNLYARLVSQSDEPDYGRLRRE